MAQLWTIGTGAALALAFAGSAASADITVTQGASGSTYANTLNFDEPGGAVGDGLADTAFAGNGLATLVSGDGLNRVGNFDAVTGSWGLGGGTNSFTGNFGVFMTFDQDVTDFSAQVWDPSGEPSPFGGGLAAVVLNDGQELAFVIGEPAWGGAGDSWWNISATNGMVFDEIRLLGFGFTPTTYIDDISWNVVPAPSGVACLGLAGLAATRRRR